MEASSNSIVDAHYRNYCVRVGHLFAAFSRFETGLTATLKLHLANNINEQNGAQAKRLSAAIYGSMRFKASRDNIKRILEIEGADRSIRDVSDDIFLQVGHIEAFRDKIAHQIVAPGFSGGGKAFWQVSDYITTRDSAAPKVWVFDNDAVAAAGHDLVVAGDAIGPRPVEGRLFTHLAGAQRPAWQYRPSMLKLVSHNKRRNRSEPPHQPPS
jgi:hypothetical protein